MWWRNAVIYQVYTRSFQDTDGDGIGDLRGVRNRLGYLRWLGVDAIWLSPIYPSPLADLGYDVADFCDVDPAYGDLAEFDALVAEAHRHSIRVLLDLVVGHTALTHPWFREHPERYTWWEGDEPPNNWIAAFGGPAWSRDEVTGAWYHHAFYPEQPSLNWLSPGVPEAMQDVIRFWRRRGVDGFRIDALEHLTSDPQLRDDPPAPPSRELPLPDTYYAPAYVANDHVHSQAAEGREQALHDMRDAAGDALLLGEVITRTPALAEFLEVLDTAFCFEFLLAVPTAEALRRAIERSLAVGPLAWARSNHDFARLPTSVGADRVRAMLLVLLTLPGPAVLYQGDEIGLPEGPGSDPPIDRAGRDRLRHPMPWDSTTDFAGFSTATPWLPVAAPTRGSVQEQLHDQRSILTFVRHLVRIRRQLGRDLRFIDAPDGVLAYQLQDGRDSSVVAVNLGERPAPAPTAGSLLATTRPDRHGSAPKALAPGEGFVATAPPPTPPI